MIVSFSECGRYDNNVVIELQPKEMHKWTVIMGVERAVDNILSGKTFLAQVRRRDSENGLASLELVDA